MRENRNNMQAGGHLCWNYVNVFPSVRRTGCQWQTRLFQYFLGDVRQFAWCMVDCEQSTNRLAVWALFLLQSYLMHLPHSGNCAWRHRKPFCKLHLWTCHPGRDRLPVNRFTVNLNCCQLHQDWTITLLFKRIQTSLGLKHQGNMLCVTLSSGNPSFNH